MNTNELYNESNTATYCPEDNKIRLYVGRVPRDDYMDLRGDGWKATPKQDCDFVASWTPSREDTALDYAGYIGDEDQSPTDRAADRAERFSMYRDKRRGEAHDLADTFDAGPAVHGYQSQDKADRAATRHDRKRLNSLTQWDKAEYWQTRTAGVISNALHKESAHVRRGRIVKLETASRKDWISDRWKNHYNLRIAYEKQMIEADGGSASNVDMIPGGFFGSYQIHKVHKSNVTKQVVSVSVLAPAGRFCHSWQIPKDGKPHIQKVNIQRHGEDVYRSPTAEELEAFKAEKKSLQAKTKKANVGKPKLINPTPEDAQRLQDALNEAATRPGQDAKPSTVREMTQAEYSAHSKGSYSSCEAVYLTEKCTLTNGGGYRGLQGQSLVCKIRKGPSNAANSGYGVYAAYSVIVITDKPQKMLPWARMEEIENSHLSIEDLTPQLRGLFVAMREAGGWFDRMPEDTQKLCKEAEYQDLIYISSMTQMGLTDKAAELLKTYEAQEVTA